MPSRVSGERSEIASLAAIRTQVRAALRYLDAIEERYPDAHTTRNLHSARLALGHIEEESGALLAQVHSGIHRNPPLVVFSNPAWGSSLRSGRFEWVHLMSRDLHLIRYTHADDGKDYQHDFENAEMYAVRRVGVDDPADRAILIVSEDGAWKDFK